jgi:hypothetical protein
VPSPSPKIIGIPVCERETIAHQNLDTTPDHQPQENILSSWQSNVAKPIKCLKVKSCRTQMSEGSYTPFASIISRSLRHSMSRPAFIGRKTDTCLEWRRRPSPYPETDNISHKREIPSHQHLLLFATCKNHDIVKREETLELSRVKNPSAKDFIDPSDPSEDQQNFLNESEPTLIHETESLPELQLTDKAILTSREMIACQDVYLTTKNKISTTVQSLDQLYIHVCEVYTSLTTSKTDERNFIRKQKQGRPPDPIHQYVHVCEVYTNIATSEMDESNFIHKQKWDRPPDLIHRYTRCIQASQPPTYPTYQSEGACHFPHMPT